MKSLFGKLTANDKKAYSVPTSIQALFVIVLLGSFLIQMVQMTYMGIQQYADNPHVGGFYSYYVGAIVVPALLYLIAYAMNPRKLGRLSKAFESLLLAIAGLTVWTLTSFIDPALFIDDPGSKYVESYAIFQIVSSGVMVALYTGVLYWLRRTKRWA